MAEFGIPYMGSKNKIAREVCSLFPKADNFYDLFGGGFSITHCMVKHRSKDYKQFHFNEIRKGMTELIQDAIAGKYSYENFKPKWISRDEFFEKKETDLYIKLCWSFGNNGDKGYLFGEDIEGYKKSMHNAIIFNEFDDTAKKILGTDSFKESYSIKDKRLFVKERIRYLNKNKKIKEDIVLKRGDLQQLERLQQLQRLEELEELEELQRLNFYNKSYDEVEIKPNSVIYCDPPYSGTADYDKNKSFNSKKFLDWADSQENPVFVSEYNISDKRFTLIKKIKKRSMLSSNKSACGDKDEKVYCNKSAVSLLKR